MEKYNLFFVPEFKDRRKISPLRSKICNLVHSTQALQYPVHMSLISGGFKTNDFALVEKTLKEFCKKQQPFVLRAEKDITILPHRFWVGISIKRTNELKKLQTDLQTIRNKYSIKKEKHLFHPLHITLAFPAKVENLEKTKNPVAEFIFDKITVVKRGKDNKYRIYKKIRFG